MFQRVVMHFVHREFCSAYIVYLYANCSAVHVYLLLCVLLCRDVMKASLCLWTLWGWREVSWSKPRERPVLNTGWKRRFPFTCNDQELLVAMVDSVVPISFRKPSIFMFQRERQILYRLISKYGLHKLWQHQIRCCIHWEETRQSWTNSFRVYALYHIACYFTWN